MNSKTACIYQCLRCNSEVQLRPANVLTKGTFKTGCPLCNSKAKWDQERYDAMLGPLKIKRLGPFIKTRAKLEHQCGVCEHRWSTEPHTIINHKSGCPECAPHSRMNITKVNARLVDRGIECLSFTKTREKGLFRCTLGHEWWALPKEVMQRSGCPVCYPGGAGTLKTAYIYVMSMSGKYKIGVSGKVITRKNQINKESPYPVRLVHVWAKESTNGSGMLAIEAAAHRHFSDRNAGLSGWDGATEFFNAKLSDIEDFLKSQGLEETVTYDKTLTSVPSAAHITNWQQRLADKKVAEQNRIERRQKTDEKAVADAKKEILKQEIKALKRIAKNQAKFRALVYRVKVVKPIIAIPLDLPGPAILLLGGADARDRGFDREKIRVHLNTKKYPERYRGYHFEYYTSDCRKLLRAKYAY